MNQPANELGMLFAPRRIGAMTIPGRIIKTATTETMGTVDGFVTDELVAFYEPYAEAGTPLIVTGNFYTQRSGKVYHRMPRRCPTTTPVRRPCSASGTITCSPSASPRSPQSTAASARSPGSAATCSN